MAGGPTEQELAEVARWVSAATDVGKRGRLSAAVRQPDVCEALHSAGVTEAVGTLTLSILTLVVAGLT